MAVQLANDSITLTVPGHISYLPLCQSCVRAFAGRAGFDDRALSDIELSVEEAVTNVIEHALDPADAATFDIICRRTPLGVRIDIKEKGIPFDPSALPRYSPEALADEVSATGLGLFLMKQVMDEVSFHNLGAAGKKTRLVKYLPRKNIEAYFSPEELKPHPEPAAGTGAPAGKIDYVVRRLRPAEAIEVSKCAYKSHGYTFFDDHIYYPERIIELNESDEMISAVGVTGDNVFMGHAALVYPEAGARIAEWTFGFVNPEFRSQGFLKRAYEFHVATPKRYPLDGLYAYCVTNHVISQKTTARFGINDCGILLATSPATWEFKGIDGDTSQRMSVVLSFQYIGGPRPLTLYAPPQHLDMLQKLYGHIGASHCFAVPEGGQAACEGESVMETAVNMSESCADITIKKYGAQAARELRSVVRELCLKQIACIDLFLSLEDPATCHLTAEFEKLGFFFAGMLPCTQNGDALILQYLNNVPLDYDKLQLYTDMSREILGYIRRHDPNAGL